MDAHLIWKPAKSSALSPRWPGIARFLRSGLLSAGRGRPGRHVPLSRRKGPAGRGKLVPHRPFRRAGRRAHLPCPLSPGEKRPLACRIFPLTPVWTGENWTVRMDARARAMCSPVSLGGQGGAEGIRPGRAQGPAPHRSGSGGRRKPSCTPGRNWRNSTGISPCDLLPRFLFLQGPEQLGHLRRSRFPPVPGLASLPGAGS